MPPIRVEWRGQCTCIVPALPTLMALLRPSVKIAADEREDHDFTKTDGTRNEQESRVLELLERGQKIAAVKLVQKLYKYDLTQAMRFVEELKGA